MLPQTPLGRIAPTTGANPLFLGFPKCQGRSRQRYFLPDDAAFRHKALAPPRLQVRADPGARPNAPVLPNPKPDDHCSLVRARTVESYPLLERMSPNCRYIYPVPSQFRLVDRSFSAVEQTIAVLLCR